MQFHEEFKLTILYTVYVLIRTATNTQVPCEVEQENCIAGEQEISEPHASDHGQPELLSPANSRSSTRLPPSSSSSGQSYSPTPTMPTATLPRSNQNIRKKIDDQGPSEYQLRLLSWLQSVAQQPAPAVVQS